MKKIYNYSVTNIQPPLLMNVVTGNQKLLLSPKDRQPDIKGILIKHTHTQSPPPAAVQPAKGIKHESGQASEFSCQFAENAEDTGTC